MKKFILRAVFPVVLGLALLLVGTGTKAYSAGLLSFEIKLSGGIGYLFNGGGDLENSRLGMQAYATNWVEQDYTSTFDWKKLSVLPDFRGEFILKFGNYFGVGFGAGYQSMKSVANFSFMYDWTYTDSYGQYVYTDDDIYTDTYKVTNIPIFMNFYGFLPMRNMSLYAYIGPSFNFGSYSMDRTNDWTLDNKFTSSFLSDEEYKYAYNGITADKATCTAFGFQGGLGIEINLSPFLAIGLEAYGRYVNFSNWTGTSDYSWNSQEKYYYEPWGWWLTINYSGTENYAQATLYDYDWIWSYNHNAYNEMGMWETSDPPSGSSYSNVHTAKINFNAIGALFSIIIHF